MGSNLRADRGHSCRYVELAFNSTYLQAKSSKHRGQGLHQFSHKTLETLPRAAVSLEEAEHNPTEDQDRLNHRKACHKTSESRQALEAQTGVKTIKAGNITQGEGADPFLSRLFNNGIDPAGSISSGGGVAGSSSPVSKIRYER